MDVSVQLASANLGAGDGLKAGMREVAAKPPAHDAAVMRFNDAFGRTPKVADPNVAGVIDRIRADFESFRLRMAAGNETRLVNAQAQSGPAQLAESMNLALRAQMDMFEMAVAFNAGLTASQQSQSGVKTLVEKS
jgi:hypothetical protein